MTMNIKIRDQPKSCLVQSERTSKLIDNFEDSNEIPLKDVHELNAAIARILNQLDGVVLKAHKLYCEGYLPTPEIEKFSFALEEVQNLLTAWNTIFQQSMEKAKNGKIFLDTSSFYSTMPSTSMLSPTLWPSSQPYQRMGKREGTQSTGRFPSISPSSSFSQFSLADSEPWEFPPSPTLSLAKLKCFSGTPISSEYLHKERQEVKEKLKQEQVVDCSGKFEAEGFQFMTSPTFLETPQLTSPPHTVEQIRQRSRSVESLVNISPCVTTEMKVYPPSTAFRHTASCGGTLRRRFSSPDLRQLDTPPYPEELVSRYPESFKKWGGSRKPYHHGSGKEEEEELTPLPSTPSMRSSPPATCQPIRLLESGARWRDLTAIGFKLPSPFLTPSLNLQRRRSPDEKDKSPAWGNSSLRVLPSPNGFSSWQKVRSGAKPTSQEHFNFLQRGSEKLFNLPTPQMDSPPTTTNVSGNRGALQEIQNLSLEHCPKDKSSHSEGKGFVSVKRGENYEKEFEFSHSLPSGFCSAFDDQNSPKSFHGDVTKEASTPQVHTSESMGPPADFGESQAHHLDLKQFPSVFQRGKGADQLQQVFNAFLPPLKEVANATEHSLSLKQSLTLVPHFGLERISLLLDLLTSRGVLDCIVVKNEFRWRLH